MLYTLEQAEIDAKLILQNQDLDITSTPDVIIKNLHNEILSLLALDHFKTQRMLNFQESALKVEFEILEEQKFNKVNVACNGPSKSNKLTSISSKSINSKYLSLWDSLPITLNVKNIPNINIITTSPSSSDNSLKQLQRDIQRDQILINGELLKGADVGLEGAMSILSKTIDYVLTECEIPLMGEMSPLQPLLKEKFCYDILHTACRTNSGGVSYSGLQSMLSKSNTDIDDSINNNTIKKSKNSYFSNPNINNNNNNNILSKYIIVPQSNLAPPLRLRFSIGQFSIDTDVAENLIETQAIQPTPPKSTFFSLFSRRFFSRSISSSNNSNNITADGTNNIITDTEIITTTTNTNIDNNNDNNLDSSITEVSNDVVLVSMQSDENLQLQSPQQKQTSSSTNKNNNNNNQITLHNTNKTVTSSAATIMTDTSSDTITEKSSSPCQRSIINNNNNKDDNNKNNVDNTALNSWGVKCHIECITIFLLKPIHDEYNDAEIATNNNQNSSPSPDGGKEEEEEEVRTLKVTYSNSIVLPLKLTCPNNDELLLEHIINSGQVYIDFYTPPSINDDKDKDDTSPSRR